MGAVVFTYDMIGYGDSHQSNKDDSRDNHDFPKATAIQLLTSVRAVDFVETLDDIDVTRIGMTGRSGGGTQTALAASIDNRIAVIAPNSMISAISYGGCICESGMPIYRSADHETVLAEIAALAAPRPQLLISSGGDWTKNMPTIGFPYIQNIYGLYGQSDAAQNEHFATLPHGTHPDKRQAVYAFFEDQFGLNPFMGEEGSVPEDWSLQSAYNDEHPRPMDALIGETQILEAFNRVTNASNLINGMNHMGNSGFNDPVEYLWDNSTKTWASDLNSDPAWIEFVFNEQLIAEALMFEDNASNQVTSWRLRKWTGSAWVDIFDWVPANTDGWHTQKFNASARRVRFEFKNGGTNSPWPSVHELKLFASNNLVNSVTHSTNSGFNDPVENIWDDRTATWATDLDSDPAFIEFEFNEQTINEAMMYEDNASNQVTAWRLRKRVASDWQNIFDWTSTDHRGWHTEEFSSTAGRVRFEFYNNGSGSPWPSIHELVLHGNTINDLTIEDNSNAGDWSIQKGIQDGVLQYGDRDYTVSSLPAYLYGSDWIRTANDSKRYTGSSVATFTVSSDCDVYIAVDDRLGLLPWLSSWIDTGDNLVNSEPRVFSLFKRPFPADSTVEIGTSGISASSFYTIIAKR
jgi:hypothetical protein